MAQKPRKKKSFPSSVGDLTIRQLVTLIDRRIAGGEIPWPLRPNSEEGWSWQAKQFPWPYPYINPQPHQGSGPWQPNFVEPRFGGHSGAANVAFSASPSAYVHTSAAISTDLIWSELKSALVEWKPRFGDVTESTKLASMTASGDGRFDILSAVARSAFFNSLGLVLHYFQIGGDETLEDVIETIGRLLEDLGHVVQS